MAIVPTLRSRSPWNSGLSLVYSDYHTSKPSTISELRRKVSWVAFPNTKSNSQKFVEHVVAQLPPHKPTQNVLEQAPRSPQYLGADCSVSKR